jgi:hypothetical protein
MGNLFLIKKGADFSTHSTAEKSCGKDRSAKTGHHPGAVDRVSSRAPYLVGNIVFLIWHDAIDYAAYI